MVLSADHALLPPVAQERFSISIDAGPPFHPPHVRLEGDDPISLAILMVLTPSTRKLGQKIGVAVAEIGANSLTARDRLSVYIENECGIAQIFHDLPATDSNLGNRVSEALQKTVKVAEESRSLPKCASAEAPNASGKAPLWDGLAYAIDQESRLAGRRVVLAISTGMDGRSSRTWLEVRFQGTRAGFAIFGLQLGELRSSLGHLTTDLKDRFNILCELTGGLVFTTTEKSVNRRLGDFVTVLRDRYIVEFPRPEDAKAGEHGTEVSISHLPGFIRPGRYADMIVNGNWGAELARQVKDGYKR